MSIEIAAPTSIGGRQDERGRVPDFFVVGHSKSGTTAMYQMLRQHPGIFMPADSKEPGFFGRDCRRRFTPRRLGNVEPTSLDDYLCLFAEARSEQLVGEASGFYLSSGTAASEISAFNPAARIIAIFREPATFLRSLHLQLLQNREDDERNLRTALALEPERRRGRHIPRHSSRPQLLRYSDHVRYTDQLRRYHEAFPPEQVLVLLYEDFRVDNRSAVRAIFRFLDVDDSVHIMPVEANASVELRSPILEDALHRFSVGRDSLSRTVKAGIKAIVPLGARRRLLRTVQSRVIHEPSPPDPGLMADLRTWLKPEVERFSEYLGRDLVSFWAYDRV